MGIGRPVAADRSVELAAAGGPLQGEKAMMSMRLELRQEIHDDRCIRCGTPKASDRECGPCALENAKIASSGSLESAARNIDEAEKNRTERRKNN